MSSPIPPDVSGVGADWYVDSTWTGTITPDVAAAQSNYHSKLLALQSATTSYTTQRDLIIADTATLNGDLQAQPQNPVTIAHDKQTLDADRTAFNTAEQNFNQALSNLESAMYALLTAQNPGVITEENAASSTVDTLADTDLTDFANTLKTLMNSSLTLSGTNETQTFGTDFSDADTARTIARSTFTTALGHFITDQDALNTDRNALQQLNDNLLLAKAKLASDTAGGASQSTIDQDNANISSLNSQITAKTTTVNTATTTRDGDLTSLHTALKNYQGAIDHEISILSQAAQAMQVSATQYLQDLETAKQNASTAEQTALAHAFAADQAAHQQLLTDFPTDNPAIDAAVQAFYNQEIGVITGTTQAALTVATQTTSHINLPTLPPAGSMSMSQLMQFITIAEVLLDELIRELRRADAQVNELRLDVYFASGTADSNEAFAQLNWANALKAADSAYDDKVAGDNETNSTNSVNEVQNVIDNVDSINQVITQLNSEITAQNTLGVTVVTDLNSSVQITVDDNKLRLWADQGQLSTLVDQLNTTISLLNASDPTKAPLQTVKGDIATVVGYLNAVSEDLSVRPVAATLATDLTNLGSAQTIMNNAITALPTLDSQTQSVLNSVTKYINNVTQDQTTLQDGIASAEANAASALMTQFSSESSLLTSYGVDLTTAIANLDSGDPNIAKLNTLNDDVTAVAGALSTVAGDLTAIPVNFTTLKTHQDALDQALSTLSTDRGKIHDNSLSSDALAAVQNIDAAVLNIGDTETFLTTYRTSTTTTPTIPPALPMQVQMPIMPAPTQLQPYPTLDVSGITIPLSLPSVEPSASDVADLNTIIHNLNQIIVPLLPRLKAAGVDVSALDPLFIRGFIPIRDPSVTLDFTALITFFVLITLFVIEAQIVQSTTHGNPSTAQFLTTAASLALPNLVGSVANAQGVGAGTGIGGANLFSAAGNIGQSLTRVLTSTEFLNYVNGIIQQSAILAGVQALATLPPTAVVPAPATTVPTAAAAPPVVDEHTLALGIQELLNTANNVPQLQQGLIGVLKALGPQDLNEEEIKKLLSLLLFLLQLVALLVAAVAAAAGGGATNIDQIVQQAFTTAQNANLTGATSELTLLGVPGLPAGITPANPTFLQTFFNAVIPQLTPAEQAGFVAQVATVFSNNGITLNTNLPLGTAIQNALSTANPGVASTIRDQLNTIAESSATQLSSDILSDDTKRTNASTGLNASNAQAVTQLPQNQVSQISTQLSAAAPAFANLSTASQNTLILAVANGLITPEQQAGFVNEFAQEETTQKAPQIGVLLSLAIQQQPGFAATEPGTPTTKLGRPGQLPDLVSLIGGAFKALAKQTDDQGFTQEVVTLFANLVRDQGDYYHRSLSLILGPALTYVKNFSIETRQTTGHDTLGSITSIPIAG